MNNCAKEIFTIILYVFVVALFTGNYSVTYASEIKINYVRIPEVAGNETIYLVAKIYRPNDNEIHPLIIINHGRSFEKEERKKESVNYFQAQAEWFVDNNFAVVVPIRRGYGNSEGEDAEGEFGYYNPYQTGMEGAKDVKDVIGYMKKEKYVDKNKIVLVGQSCGGLVAMALASQNIEGVIGVVNFAGGLNNRNQEFDKDLFKTFGKFGKTTKISTLWIYTRQDDKFSPYYSQGMYDSFTKNGGKATLKLFSSPSGHFFFSKGLDVWKDTVQEYFKTIGVE